MHLVKPLILHKQQLIGNEMFEKRKTNYLSDIDKFLTNFDENNIVTSSAKKKEVEKFNNIKQLRD